MNLSVKKNLSLAFIPIMLQDLVKNELIVQMLPVWQRLIDLPLGQEKDELRG